ncbi:hypothetical protein B4102_3573 [Heyndrickxia sporothermodurans]|uniref:DNA-binding protein n=1 Tax=Heyndrickxia sporothermodurans TaxID=46224 RepID=A0A150KMW3_9BACI|nr:hypothetical protein [Heyndrickxia sporothermodurans]KYC94352.1 hypothetical protein B4102_3573 [Heyndrickxia sporothermodurans]
MNSEQIKKWVDENLLTKQEAMEVTQQSLTSFNQSIEAGRLVPFYDHGVDRSRVRLYLKSDVEAYAKQVAERRKNLKKNN